MAGPNINLPKEQVADFCRRWQVSELALFGSVLRDDFNRDSDLDVLATFAPGAERLSPDFRALHPEIPWALMAGMRDQLIHGYDIVDLDEVWKTAVPMCRLC